ncbi:MAG: ATP-binding cassette domain-containing protein [Planctomycetota bacterium]
MNPDDRQPPPDTDIVLETRALGHGFGDLEVLHDINLHIARGQIVALVGPSGCGKSTLLRAILGTHPARAGAALMNGDTIRSPHRSRGIVYQRYSLYPFLTARENVAFGPMLDQTSTPFRWFRPFAWRSLRRRHLDEADRWLDRVGLVDARHRYPGELSGGMRQRVAFAAAKVMGPDLLLLDEPFGALDEATREDLQRLLLERYRENLEAKAAGNPPPHTILIVTHELNEAIIVADRVLGLSQYWNYREHGHDHCPGATIVYDRPAPVFTPEEHVETESLIAQREAIRRIVFEPQPPAQRYQHDTYWKDARAGIPGSVVSATPTPPIPAS